MFTKKSMNRSIPASSDEILLLKEWIQQADSILIGAGAGLSTSAGFVYSGERFDRYFSDFATKYGFHDMYSDGFYPYSTLEEYWAYWSRYIYINRYMNAPKPVYEKLLSLVKGKDYFVLTTNVDHCFQKAGFDKHRLFYTQGDYGLFQCMDGCNETTYDNEEIIRRMVLSQGFEILDDKFLLRTGNIKMTIPKVLIPYCPECGKPLVPNLRTDSSFVEDEGWHKANLRYQEFVQKHKNRNLLLLELGIGYNTPIIIKYPFWNLTIENKNIRYAAINLERESYPEEMKKRAIHIENDISKSIEELTEED